MSKNFYKWKEYYEKGYLDAIQLHNLIGKKKGLTAEEYTKITGLQP